MPVLPLLRSRTKLLVVMLCLPMLVGLAAAPASVGAQTPTPGQPLPPAPTPTAAPAPPAPPADFLSYVGDILPQRERDLYIMRVDGTDKKQLTQGFNVWFASWAPDGRKLAVTTEGAQIYTLNADGSNLQLLTNGAYSPPFWSPDGHFIAFVGGEKFGMPIARGNLCIIPAGGGTAWEVPGGEDIPSLPPGASAVAWSPDGTRIAAGWPGRILHVADGPGAPVGIEALPGSNQNLFVIGGGWAPDSKHLAVTDGINYGILDLTNGNFVSVAQSLNQPGQPTIARAGVSWSAGIGKVAFSVNSAAQDGQRLFLADLDGKNAKIILSAPHVAVYHGEVSDYGPPFFSADSKTMLLRVSRTAKQPDGTLLFTHESWLVNTDGSGGQKLVDGFNANWQPKTKLKLPDSAFWFQWRVPDLAVSNGQATRAYLWGPTAIYTGSEPYAEGPGGNELVVYFDKGRMDLPDPNPPQPSRYVMVPGALAKEMVTGQIAKGTTETAAHPLADVPVAGDAGDANAPTYVTFNKLGAATDAGKAQDQTGEPVAATLARDGTVGTNSDLGALAKFAAYVPETGHNIPDIFLNYFKGQSWDWIYIAGYPIAEPYWANVQVAGQAHNVLIQVFERRTITFDPSAPDGFKVQFGNVGRHYYNWLYGTK